MGFFDGGFGGIIGGVLGLGGAALGASGASSQAKAENAARERELKLFADEAAIRDRYLQLAQAKGPAYAIAVAKARGDYDKAFGTAGTPAQTINPAGANGDAKAINDQLKALTDKYGGNLVISNGKIVGQSGVSREDYQRVQNLLGQQALIGQANGKPIDIPAVAGQPGLLNLADFQALGPGYVEKYNQLADSSDAMGKGTLGNYDQQTGLLDRQARQLTASTQSYGRQEEAKIRRDADRALTGANRATQRRLQSSGLFNSTIGTQAIGANARGINESTADALGQIGDRRLGLVTGLEGQRLNLANQRAGGRTTLDLGLQERGIGLRQGALGTEIAATTNASQNPWLGKDLSGFVPSQSPSGLAAQTFGNFAAGAGGSLLFSNIGAYGQGGGSNARSGYPVDWSYQPGSTNYGSNRPR